MSSLPEKSECHSDFTVRAAARFKVAPATFASWRWQMAQQIRTREDALRVMTLSADEAKGFDELGTLFNA